MMQFESISEFLAMGGHGLYVWLAYGSTVAVLLFSTLALRGERRKQLQQIRWQMQVQGQATLDNAQIPGNESAAQAAHTIAENK